MIACGSENYHKIHFQSFHNLLSSFLHRFTLLLVFFGGEEVCESLAIITTTEAWRVEQARPRTGNFRPAANCNLPLYARWLRTDCYMKGRTRHPSRHLGLQEGSGRCNQVGQREGGRRENNSEPTLGKFRPYCACSCHCGSVVTPRTGSKCY